MHSIRSNKIIFVSHHPGCKKLEREKEFIYWQSCNSMTDECVQCG